MSRESEAAGWFARMRAKDADTSRAAFEAWMRDPANAAAYAEYENDWKLSGALSPAPRARSRAERRSARFAPGGTRWALATAATIALALIVAWQLSQPRDTPQIASGPMLPGELRLADGSKVKLMEGAWVEPQFTATERRVRLHGGRARFEVVHDAKRPFVVVAGGSETVALGTIFEIDLYHPDMPRIALVEGSVEVRSAAGKLRLKPGETAEVPAAGPRIMTSPAVLTQASLVKVNGSPLAEILERANRINAKQIHLADPELANLELTGTFELKDGAALSRKLGAALDLEVENRDGEIFLARPE